MSTREGVRIAQGSVELRPGPAAAVFHSRILVVLFVALALVASSLAAAEPVVSRPADRALFMEAWSAARSGPRSRFEELGPRLKDYVLYPYWQYEDYRHRRAQVAPPTLAAFLEAHEDWAFTPGLRTAWLKTLGKRAQWQALLAYGATSKNTEVRCYHARARLATGDTDGLLDDVKALWTVGRSQPDACDPLFVWLRNQGAITPELAWERIRLAMAEGNPRLTFYLARFLPNPDRTWLDRWQRFDQDRYRRLDRATSWHDSELTRMIAEESLRRLARLDPDRAMALYGPMERHFDWSSEVRGDLAREIALWALVDLHEDALAFVRRVPPAHRNDQLHEWWARAAMARDDWPSVLEAIDGLEGEAADDDRWRYWRARAQLATGEAASGKAELDALASRTNYYGFLAADQLRQPYTICPKDPPVSDSDIDALAAQPRFHRALELHRAELNNWAAAEWTGAARALPTEELKVAAGLARREGWHDRTIFALGDSGELRFYEWRFPVLHTDAIMAASGDLDLDPSWVLGIMRSESAMMETAKSSAGALGLMQVTPATARTLARQHGLSYRSSRQLLDGDVNIRFGTTYLRQLLDEYGQNPVLVSGAYNAGPNAVNRWLDSRSLDEAAQWVETLPYYETRDYIPRVLTFTTLYDWRLGNPVRRISSRMPGIESGTMSVDPHAQVVCRPPEDPAGEVAASGP